MRSTQPSALPIKIEYGSQENYVQDFTKHNDNSRTHNVFLRVTDMNGKMYTDQTGRFPITSSRNNKYIMIVYDYDSNTINIEYLNSRTGYVLKTSYEKNTQAPQITRTHAQHIIPR